MLGHSCHVPLFTTQWTVAHQAPLSMGFSRQEYWSGLPCPPPGYLSHPGIELASLLSPALADRFFTINATRGSQTKASIHQFSFPSNSFKLKVFNYIKWNHLFKKKKKKGGGGASLVAQSVKKSASQCRRLKLDPWVWKTLWRRKWQPIQVFLPGEFHEQRNLECYSPWVHKE